MPCLVTSQYSQNEEIENYGNNDNDDNDDAVPKFMFMSLPFSRIQKRHGNPTYNLIPV